MPTCAPGCWKVACPLPPGPGQKVASPAETTCDRASHWLASGVLSLRARHGAGGASKQMRQRIGAPARHVSLLLGARKAEKEAHTDRGAHRLEQVPMDRTTGLSAVESLSSRDTHLGRLLLLCQELLGGRVQIRRRARLQQLPDALAADLLVADGANASRVVSYQLNSCCNLLCSNTRSRCWAHSPPPPPGFLRLK